MRDYAEGGYVGSPPAGSGRPGIIHGPILMGIDPDECFISRDGVCRRPGHPTPTSDGNKADAFWRCDGKP